MREHSHIHKSFDAELLALKQQILAMGGLVEAHIAESTRALVERQEEVAHRLKDADRAVNQLELAIDEQCIRMLALRQPAASDLRFIAASLKMVTDLERIGDLAVNMAERVETLVAEPPLPPVVDIPRMAAAAGRMLHEALDAFVTHDLDMARAVLRQDDEVDGMFRDAFEILRLKMEKDPVTMKRCLALLFFAKHLERVADHATNIAEMVVYLVQGQDVRHPRMRNGGPKGETAVASSKPPTSPGR